MTPRFTEMAAVITSFTVLIVLVLHFQVGSPYYIFVLAAVWGVWACARLELPEYTRYSLALGMLLPVGMIAYMLYNGELLAVVALPVLVRSGMLLSLHDRVRAGCIEIVRDMKRW